jgi:uncharacterized membrane protein
MVLFMHARCEHSFMNISSLYLRKHRFSFIDGLASVLDTPRITDNYRTAESADIADGRALAADFLITDDQQPPERIPAHPRETMEVIHNIHSGPLPRPQDFEAYNRILPGAADRILTMAETQGAHRQLLERRALTADMIQQATGTILGYLAFFVSMIAAFILLYLDKPIEGLVALV